MDLKVSVIIPVFNGAKYLKRAVDSAYCLKEVGEIIIIDDGSNDDSAFIAQKLQKEYQKVKFLRHADKKNHGPAQTRNLGIKKASFDFISFLDSDDYYLPNRFITDSKIFESESETDVVYNCSIAKFENGSSRERYFSLEESDIFNLSEKIPSEKLFKALLFYWYGRLHTSTITIKKKVLEKTGLFTESLRWAEDTEMWLKLSLKANMKSANITTPVSHRFIHDSNIVHQVDKAKFYKNQMYYSLFEWALRNKCTFENLNDIFNAHQNFHKQYKPKAEKNLLKCYLKRYKGFFFHKFFLKKLLLIVSE